MTNTDEELFALLLADEWTHHTFDLLEENGFVKCAGVERFMVVKSFPFGGYMTEEHDLLMQSPANSLGPPAMLLTAKDIQIYLIQGKL